MAEIIQINTNTWRVEDGMVRFFILEGIEKSLVIDTGMNTPDALDIAKTVTSKKIELLNTHADRDHISGNAAFDTIYLSPAEAENYKRAGGNDSFIPVREGDVIDLGNRPLKIYDIPGHTPGSIAILDINNRVLIAGDSVQDGNIFMFGEFRNISEYIPSMEKLLTFKDEYEEVYPSHGSFPVKPDIIPKLIEGAKEIESGKAEGKEIDLFGNKVTLYKFEYAGFFGELR